MDGWRREDYMSSDGRLMPRGEKKKKWGILGLAYLTLGMRYVGGRRYIVGEVCMCVYVRLYCRLSSQQHSTNRIWHCHVFLMHQLKW